MFVKGSVPGSKNSVVFIQKNAKKINRTNTLEKSKKIEADTSKPTVKTKSKESTENKKDTPTKKVEKKEEKKK